MRTEAAAQHMHHSPKTLEKWRVLGTGPTYVKMGRVVLYDREAIDRFLSEHTRRSTADQNGFGVQNAREPGACPASAKY